MQQILRDKDSKDKDKDKDPKDKDKDKDPAKLGNNFSPPPQSPLPHNLLGDRSKANQGCVAGK